MNTVQPSSLQPYLTQALDDAGIVATPPVYLDAGWESDLYTFALESGPGTARRREEWVLRLYNGEGAALKAQRETQALRHLHAAGYPVRRVLLMGTEAVPLGRPFLIMERIAGEQLWPLLGHTATGRRAKLLTQFSHLLVQLHDLDWRPPALSHHRLPAPGRRGPGDAPRGRGSDAPSPTAGTGLRTIAETHGAACGPSRGTAGDAAGEFPSPSPACPKWGSVV